ncbi:hypothetical protein BZG72_15250 [Salinivibrio sp. PR6]|uniref:beta-1,6-N-acetylglucosaminyltransferase n=1 Tax=Salinivibrio sp. PR6 TaxID=1909485 RepID=UPI00098948EC|nr:beta-1,6-N-acetylglucosaminyltransferase [Salinivibrio sp. PR6]OOE78665.1 hypothetical protein BZG72_15250 [Salinivibrio sp. PR6]
MPRNSVRHAILIMCHRVTNAFLFSLKQISESNDTIGFVHVDAKKDLAEFLELERYNNVFFLRDRIPIFWGGVSQITATLNSMKYICANYNFEYISLISGDDFLYKGLQPFNQYLGESKKTEFIGVCSLSGVNDREGARFLYRYNDVFFDRSNSIKNKFTRVLLRTAFSFGLMENKMSKPFEVMYKGSNWFTITRECVFYILNYVHLNSSYLDYFKFSYCCDEVFFQSIVYNSKFKFFTKSYIESNEDDNLCSLRKIDWFSGPEYPKVFTYTDVLNLSDDETFVLRKVSESVSPDTLEQLSSAVVKQ